MRMMAGLAQFGVKIRIASAAAKSRQWSSQKKPNRKNILSDKAVDF